MITTRNPSRPCARVKLWFVGWPNGYGRDSIQIESTNPSDEGFDLLRIVATRCLRKPATLTDEQRSAISAAAMILHDAFIVKAMGDVLP